MAGHVICERPQSISEKKLGMYNNYLLSPPLLNHEMVHLQIINVYILQLNRWAFIQNVGTRYVW